MENSDEKLLPSLEPPIDDMSSYASNINQNEVQSNVGKPKAASKKSSKQK